MAKSDRQCGHLNQFLFHLCGILNSQKIFRLSFINRKIDLEARTPFFRFSPSPSCRLLDLLASSS